MQLVENIVDSEDNTIDNIQKDLRRMENTIKTYNEKLINYMRN